MKNIFIRAGALLMAAFVLFGAVIGVAPVQVSAAEEYTVNGVWVLNDTLSGGGNLSQDVNFTVDGSSSSYISIVFESSSGRLYYYYGVGKDWHMPYYAGWISNYKDNGDNWKTIDFGSTSQVVSDTFYSWLTANATFQAPPPDPGPLVEAVTDLKEQDLLTRVLAGVVQMIPIGLACWVGYKGLRKALALLRGILYQA